MFIPHDNPDDTTKNFIILAYSFLKDQFPENIQKIETFDIFFKFFFDSLDRNKLTPEDYLNLSYDGSNPISYLLMINIFEILQKITKEKIISYQKNFSNCNKM